MHRQVWSILTPLGWLSITGCASIMHGTTQDVGITSVPTGASVSIDNIPHGRTPVIAALSRKDSHLVRMELAGYHPFEATLTRAVSGWVWGNLVFGGVIGVGVDAISGGFYSLTPEQVTATLVPLSEVSMSREHAQAAPPTASPAMTPPASISQPGSPQAAYQPVFPAPIQSAQPQPQSPRCGPDAVLALGRLYQHGPDGARDDRALEGGRPGHVGTTGDWQVYLAAWLSRG
jgi:PEGA domain